MSKRMWIVGMVFGTALFVTIIALGVHSSAGSETKELKLLHVIVRHGARTPASTYPNDPYINETFYPIGWGQITNQGKLDLYHFGRFLRERYGGFLGSRYSPDEYYVQATDVDRTKASLQTIDAALWPPVGDQKWGPLDWQPIPVHSEPLKTDSLLLVRRPCPQYHIELDRVTKSADIQKKLNETAGLFKRLEEATGQPIKNFDDVQDVYSTLLAEESFNLTLPEWTRGVYPDEMLEPTAFSYVLNAYTPKLNRLKGGVLLKKLISDWRGKTEATFKSRRRKAFLYGGHDSTISNILSALNVWDPQIPAYGTAVLFELYKDKITRQYGLEVFLRNTTTRPPYQLTIPGCNTFCPLAKLIELTKSVVPDDWDAECATDDPNFEIPEPGGP